MKYLIACFIIALSDPGFAQSTFPDFLEGTWKRENKDSYEHWDKLNDNTLKGFAYEIVNNRMKISEYLDISVKKSQVIYTATVLNQNQGKEINFKLTKVDSTFTFENLHHNFPKKIIYQRLSEQRIFVSVSDGNQKGFSYLMEKQINEVQQKDTTILNPNYDAELALKLGSDEYGMKSYILVILKTGSNNSTDKKYLNNVFRGHLENINRLVEKGKLIVAGPLGNNDNAYRGIFILNVATFEEANALLQTDPAIRESLLGAELYNWYGSAALPEYLDFSDKVWRVKP